MSGMVENGWCERGFGLREGWVGRMMLWSSGFRKQGWRTNGDSVMLVVLVERGGAFVVWCGDGEYQLEIGGA